MTETPFNIGALRDAYANGRITPIDVTTEALRRIANYSDPAVWITRVSEDAAMARARELAAMKDGKALPLYGIPFAVKDNIDCAGIATTAGCPAFAYVPDRDATVVSRLLEAGAILMGKTNLDQFATGLVGTRSPYGAPRCVFNDAYISGGSSSGSAVAVAAGLVAFALGTDTAGSGRVPAAFNNIVGFKPTRGLISTSGVVPACRSLDCVSIFAGCVSDTSDVLEVAHGFDAADSFSRANALRTLPQMGYRFGVLAATDRESFGNEEYAEQYEAAISRLAALGGKKVEIDYAPFRETGQLLYDGPWVAERYAAIRTFIEQDADAMDPSVRRIIEGARRFDAAAAFDGQYRLAALGRLADAQWAHIDVMVLPTTPTHYKIEEIAGEPIERNKRLGLYTNFVNLLDYCAVSVPSGFGANGLPFGVTLIAPASCDAALAAIADQLHRSAASGVGANRSAPLPAERSFGIATSMDCINLVVVGAHLSDMPLNHELVGLGASFVREVRTAGDYRLFVLPNTTPVKPGLIRSPGFAGPGIACEIWSLDKAAFGTFVAKIPAPLGIGKVTLEDGTTESGFLCEAHATEGACEITSLGGWSNYYMQSRS